LLWTIVARSVLWVVLIASVGLVTWALYQFYMTFPPLTRQIRQKDSERSALASEVQQMEMDWNAEAAAKLEAEYRAAQEQLFAGKGEQDEWSSALQRRAAELAFDATLIAEAPQPHTQHTNIHLVRATLQLQQMKTGGGKTNSAYERLLALNTTLDNPRRRIDLLELSVRSDSNSVAQTQARFQMWSLGQEKMP